MNNARISFCTTSMNRLHHLRETLPRNVNDNLNYENIEFLLLDYNSGDGTEEWVKSEMLHLIEKKVLTYYRIFGVSDYRRSHSRNIMLKLASGEIYCNLDADNFAGKNFAFYVSSEFGSSDNTFLSGSIKRDALGRICALVKDMLEIRGYDESFIGYAYEDIDLIHRLERIGKKQRKITDERYLEVIGHSFKQRIENEYLAKNLFAIYLIYVNEHKSTIFYLLEGGKLVTGTIVDHQAKQTKSIASLFEENFGMTTFLGISTAQSNWTEGKWEACDSESAYYDNKRELLKINISKSILAITFGSTSTDIYKITNIRMIEDAILFYSEIYNKAKMNENVRKKISLVNENGFGNSIVYKNFDYHNPIELS